MYIWQAILGLLSGGLILIVSSEKTVDQLIKLAKIFGLSTFTIGFVIASLGSDLPEIINSVLSAYLGHGDISVGDSFGSVMTQISLVLGLIPFFCTFCRLIPSTFKYVGAVEVGTVLISIFLAMDGRVSRLDGILLIMLWAASMIILRRFAEQRVILDESIEIEEPKENMSKILGWLLIGFLGIGIGSYAVIESAVTISRAFGISEYLISFFLVSLGTSLPELVVEVSAIRRHHFDLAVGDIIGSCIVDATLAIGLGPVFFPIDVSGGTVLVTGLYAVAVSAVVVGVLSWRGVNDKRTGGLFILLYLLSYLIPYFL
ncbi:MAG: sodium:calcium antiporter [Candidatus Bathyarchaeota archaeon]|nr:sodium:calcium antiporter [Candidatus Bathyarchaeota archaeon]